jgi:voltage-gated potassium channel
MAVKVTQLLGITGVDPHERVDAVRWAQRLEWPILLVALWIPVQWYLEESGTVTLATAKYFDWAIWLVFLVETTLLTSLVRDKRRYLTNNWMNLVIIFAGVPIEWTYTPLIGALRNLRLLLMLFLLVRLSRRLRQYLARGRIGSMMAIIGITTMLAGIIVSRIDPGIGSVWDGMWWAWVTLSHTGYGDVVPHSGAGRFFGALIILLGVVLISLFTANLSAYLIGGEVEKVEKEERESDALLREVVTRLDRVERLLAEQRGQQGTATDKPVSGTRPD